MDMNLELEYCDDDAYESFNVNIEFIVSGRDWRGTREEPPEYAELEIYRLTVVEFGKTYDLAEAEVIGDEEEEGVQRITQTDLETRLWEEVREAEGDAMIDRYEAMIDDAECDRDW